MSTGRWKQYETKYARKRARISREIKVKGDTITWKDIYYLPVELTPTSTKSSKMKWSRDLPKPPDIFEMSKLQSKLNSKENARIRKKMKKNRSK